MIKHTVMTKERFLAGLRSRLIWKYSIGHANEVLADYEECFEAGAQDGKSEAELCAELGSPREIVAEISDKSKAFRMNLSFILYTIIAMFLLFTGYILFYAGGGFLFCPFIAVLLLALSVKVAVNRWGQIRREQGSLQKFKGSIWLFVMMIFIFILLCYCVYIGYPRVHLAIYGSYEGGIPNFVIRIFQKLPLM